VLATHEQHGQPTATIRATAVRPVLEFLRTAAGGGFDFLTDLAGVDGMNLGWRDHRFEVVYHLRSMAGGGRIRVKVAVPGETPEIASIHDLWKCANWFEREVFDMYGVKFRGHPNLKRILCHHRFVGHALRKDYFIRDQQWLEGEPESMLDEIADTGSETSGMSELIPINIGPAHPATHGTLRVIAKLDGETIVKSAGEIGYLHRAFEKHCEISTWTQVIPYTDRLNYCSAMLNNVGYCRAVERLLSIEVPDRTKYIRAIISEVSRIIDHLVCIGANLFDLGAATNFWYCFALREKAYQALEGLCGARLTSTYVRVGGVSDDLDRMEGVAVMPREDALSWGYTGPCLRASGVAYDLRKAEPYDFYDTFRFDVPTGRNGDSADRFFIRFEEIVQSMRIVEQALDRMPEGPVFSSDRRVVMPAKPDVYENIEALMNHFMLIYEGIKVPAGEAYSAVEGANGELGFYVISDGSGRPYRVRVRPPCFPLFASYPEMIEGEMVADAIATLGTLNIIVGELDR
jgi:NADH-quinone oxidoreductase subunit C/D